MAYYDVEPYRPSSGAESLRGGADRLAESARALGREGSTVRVVDTILLPTDETWLHLIDAASEAEVRAVAERAGIDVDRVVPAEQVETTFLEEEET
jgi:nucleotide-binding universal stress UspA family protein